MKFYYPLKKSVTILVIDDDAMQINFFKSILSSHPVYNVLTASNAHDAEKIITSKETIHISTLDLGINDLQSDEYYLLRQYAQKIPFIIISGSIDIERAFATSNHGAAGLIAKPVIMTDSKYWNTIHQTFLDYTILPKIPPNSSTILYECRNVLQRDLPNTVSEWAAKVNVTDTYLRKIWGDCTSSSPKMILFLYTLYKEAFTWFDSHYIAELNDVPCIIPQPDAVLHKRMLNYYLQNITEFETIKNGYHSSN